MSKDNDAPPPPDYTPLANASAESAKWANDLAKEQFAWAKEQWTENKKVSDQFVDFAMGQMDRQAEWAASDRERYETIFQPLEEQLAADAESYASPERQAAEAGKAEADVAQQFEQARRTAQERLESYGVDPTQTRSGAMDLQTRIAEAASQAAAGNTARERTEATGRALRSEAINVGKGYPAQVGASAAGAQNAGTGAVASGNQTTATGASTMGTAPQYGGLANQSIGNWGNILNQGYGNQLDAWKAEQSSSSGIGSMAGLAGSIITSFFDEGGVVPDDPTGGDVRSPGGGPVPAEMSPSGGVVPDDIAAIVDGQQPAALSSGEFVIPEDVMKWKGEEWMQKEITKARAAMQGGNGERPAQPSMTPPPGGGPPAPVPMQ
jgi:hypothetical protein